MNFKRINKYILLLSFLLFSCSPIKSTNDNKIDSISKIQENFENEITIDISNNSNYNLSYEDYYQPVNLDKWNFEDSFVKFKTINTFGKKINESRSLICFIYEDKFIFINHKSLVNIYDQKNFKLINSFQVDNNFIDKLSYPTSIARINDKFFITYSNSTIINFDLDGKIFWEKNFNDIIKTPIKIYGENLIVLLSNKIISINSSDGNINWNYTYENNKPLQALGGDIIDWNNLLFFILPNNRVGSIDTIFGEKNKSIILDTYFSDSVDNSNDKLFKYNNYISYFDQKEFLTTINISEDIILLDKKKIYNVESFLFYNNSLMTLNDDSILSAYNTENGNLYWKIDLSEKIKKNDKLIEVTNINDSLIVFFSSGNIFKINYVEGSLISHKNLKIKNIIKVSSNKNYIEVYQNNGKTSLLKK